MKLHGSRNLFLIVLLATTSLLFRPPPGKASPRMLQMAASASGTTEIVTRASDGAEPDYSSDIPVVSADGRYVAFYSQATDLVIGDENNYCELDYVNIDYQDSCPDLFLTDRLTGLTSLVTVSSSGDQADEEASPDIAMSDDGRYVAYSHTANNLVAGDTSASIYSDVFLRDMVDQLTIRISKGHDGSEVDGSSYAVSISADGRYVAFVSQATNLVAGDTNTTCDILGAPGGTNNCADIFVYDRDSQETVRVSVDASGAQANGASSSPSISGDGRYVALASYASNLVGSSTSGFGDIFVHDRDSDNDGVFDEAGHVQNTLVSVGTGGTAADGGSYSAAISANGESVAFVSQATNLVLNDTQNTCTVNLYPGGSYNCPDVFVYNRQSGQIVMASVDSNGAPGNGGSSSPSISADGSDVAFASLASNLVSGDTNDYCNGDTPNCRDVFVRDFPTSQTARVSESSFGEEGDATSRAPVISSGGRYVVFASHAQNLTTPHDSGRAADIFVHDREGVLYHAFLPVILRP